MRQIDARRGAGAEDRAAGGATRATDAHPLLRLQRLAGNRAVVVQRGKQTKETPRRSERVAAKTQQAGNAGLVGVDSHGRTRKAQEAKKTQKALRKLSPEKFAAAVAEANAQGKAPTAIAGTGAAIFNGNRAFRAIFAAGWWGRQAVPLTCAACANPIVAGAKGAKARSIDHITPWSVLRAGLPTVTVCKGGVHWEVVLQSEVDAANEVDANLRPTHQGCNSSKGGSKTTDNPVPQRHGNCPGASCTETKAT